MANNQVSLNCAFCPIPDKLKPTEIKQIEPPKTRKVYKLIPQAETVDGDENHVVLTYKEVLAEEYDYREYVASFADDVGIQNILKKIAISGDKSLLNQTGREPLNENGGLEPIQDYSNVPGSKTEAFNQVISGVNAFDQLPEDLKGKMSLSQFVQLFGQEEFDNYIKGIVASQTASAHEKGEE